MGHDFDRSKVKKIVFSLETVHALYVHKVVFLTENKNGPIMFGTLYYNLNYFLEVILYLYLDIFFNQPWHQCFQVDCSIIVCPSVFH